MIERVTLYVILTLASFEDLRIREVPFLLSHVTIILGLGYAAIQATQTGILTPVLHSVLGGVIAYAFGYALYASGQWGGGDVKLFTGIATFIGFNPWAPASFTAYVFLIFLTGSIYGLAWTLYRIIARAKAVIDDQPRPSVIHGGVVAIPALLVISVYAAATQPLRIAGVMASFTLFVASSLVLYVLRHAEAHITRAEKNVADLVPGDWLASPVNVDGESIDEANTGLTVRDIQRLRSSTTETVTVRVGLPFVPSFLLAYLCYDFIPVETVIRALF